MVRRGKVEVPQEYFLKMAKADYEDYRQALAREFLQNSIDAGADRVDVAIDGERRTVTVIDNGCGMDEETILTRLLVLGGSKKAEGSVGAFGKAKELLYFSWSRYWIETRNLEVKGRGADYEVREVATEVDGVASRIRIQKDESMKSIANAFRAVAAKMETDARIFVDDQEVETQVKRGELKKDLGWAKVYWTAEPNRWHMAVRIDGIWMFDRYIGEDYGNVVLELERSSLECMTSNRDGLVHKYRLELDKYLKKLAADRVEALTPDRKLVRRRLRGSGAIEVAEVELEQVETDFDFAMALAVAIGGKAGSGELVEQRIMRKLKEDPVRSWEDYEEWLDRQTTWLQNFSYEPDFVMKHTEAQRNRVKQYMRTQEAAVLAKIWTETVRQVLMDAGRSLVFTAGFVFDPDHEAQIEELTDGSVVIYVNPWKVGEWGGWEKKKLSNRRLLVTDMKDKAIHEVAHLRCSYHDEMFVDEMHKIRARTEFSVDEYVRISRMKY